MSQLLTGLPGFERPSVGLVVRRKIIGRQWTFEKGQHLEGYRDKDGTWTVWVPNNYSASFIVDVPRWYVRRAKWRDFNWPFRKPAKRRI